jgi:hypothetical protein
LASPPGIFYNFLFLFLISLLKTVGGLRIEVGFGEINQKFQQDKLDKPNKPD